REQISAGIADGSIKVCDPKLTTFLITGALNGIGAWYRPDGALSAETIAEEFVVRLTEVWPRGDLPAACRKGREARRRKQKSNKRRCFKMGGGSVEHDIRTASRAFAQPRQDRVPVRRPQQNLGGSRRPGGTACRRAERPWRWQRRPRRRPD